MAFSYPFRITPQGGAATVDPGSDQEVHELLAVLCLTTVGERVMEPEYGLPSPEWQGLSESDIISGVEEFGPEGVEVTAVIEEQVTETRSTYQIEWAWEPVEVESL